MGLIRLAERLDYAASRIGPSNAVCDCDPNDDLIVLGHHLSEAEAALRRLNQLEDFDWLAALYGMDHPTTTREGK